MAEHGVAAVSNRQVSEAAGQANNFAVGYHFGTKADLALAIVRRHAPAIHPHDVTAGQTRRARGRVCA